jgi:hypothetical protein
MVPRLKPSTMMLPECKGKNDFLKNILMRKRLKIENQLIFCEVGSIAGQGVMRIYVESSVKKKT